ncbi:MAG: Slx4p interacting protein [Cirrosporium novae-zelandiae]|nr:MAG: Slx4p interacting protein [Cirrosporium novae-zelandiae]
MSAPSPTQILKPLPAFYGCYLLRSTIRHASLYVGSTPNPLRRLKQHNGISKGGAIRTSRKTLRPWEMLCIVHGFPSSVGALQFEWAWQHSHLTRHIPEKQRITARLTRTRVSPRSGKTRRRPTKPRDSLPDRIANLHILLHVKYFSRWPLEVRFFSEDGWRVWKKWCDEHSVGKDIRVVKDFKPSEDEGKTEVTAKDREEGEKSLNEKIEGIDIEYGSYKLFLEKSQFLLAEDDPLFCSVCKDSIGPERKLVIVCPGEDCRSAFHVKCLASTFLRGQDDLLPMTGSCPSCKTEMVWADLIKEMTLRARGEKEVRKLFKKTRGRAKPKGNAPEFTDERVIADSEDDSQTESEDEGFQAADFSDAKVDLDDSLMPTLNESSTSMLNFKPSPVKFKQPPSLIIEDSDESLE